MEGRGSLRPSFLALQGIGCVSYFPVRNGLRVTRCCGRGRPAEAPPLDFGLSIGDRRSSGRRCAGGGGRDRMEGAVGVGAVGVSGAQAMLGGVGIAAMNGPAVMFCALVAIAVSTVSAVGNTPIPRIPDHRRPLRNRCGLAPGTTARTSYGGLELLHRYVRRLGLYPRLRRACADLGGGYGGARLSLLLLALFYVGARRVEHLKYLVGDPLVHRFSGLGRMPTARTVTNWLRRFTHATLRPLIQLNQELVLESLARLDVPRLTLDVDGTVVRTGATVAWAFRGFNPHHRKDLSYYPLVAHVAQTGHILRLKNRPGNVHDSKQSAAFLRELIVAVRARLGRSLPLEFRMDAAFFQRDVLRLLAARRCAYAIKVGYWSWLPLKQLAAERRQWHALAPDVTGFEHQLVIPPWNLRLRVMIYRKHVQHESPKNFQLDLFTPDDGHFEYYAVATNMALSLPALYDFIGGPGAQEKTFAELKGQIALAAVPPQPTYIFTSYIIYIVVCISSSERDGGRCSCPLGEGTR